MIVRLADLMKAVFARADADQVPLERELDLVRAYLDVERIRLGSRLAVTFDIDDAARGVLVPALLLQPIVENAVKHGVAPYARRGMSKSRRSIADGACGSSYGTPGTGRRRRPRRARSGRAGAFRSHGAASTAPTATGYRLTFDREASGTAVRIDLPAERLGVA